MTRWSDATGGGGGQDYAARFDALAAAGTDVHGEASLCAALLPPGARVLDAGCGTGRVAIRLATLDGASWTPDVGNAVSVHQRGRRSAPLPRRASVRAGASTPAVGRPSERLGRTSEAAGRPQLSVRLTFRDDGPNRPR